MGQSAIMAALAAKDAALIRAAIVGELVPVIPSATDPLTWDPRELGASGGNTWPAVIWQEKLWFRDETSVAAHDEISVITLADGVNYLTNDVRVPAAVLSYAVTTPPDPDDVDPGDRPDYGDAYLVPAASTDDWAAHEDDIAIWTARGWAYVAPSRGYLVYVEDELGYYHYTAGDAWEAGAGLYAVPVGSIRPDQELIRAWAVENQTTTAPPANGPAGEQYIIGSGATGTWAGHDGKIAWRPALNAAFVITTPFVGEQAHNKNLQIEVKWNGSAWESSAGIWVGGTAPASARGAVTTSNGTSTYYGVFASGTAPTSAQRYVEDDVLSPQYTAKRAGAILEILYSGLISNNGATYNGAIGLFRDNELNAIDWVGYVTGGAIAHVTVVFNITALDTSVHTYHIRFMGATAGQLPTSISSRYCRLQERA